MIAPTDKDALIIVDVQNDFCPGGALPVKGGDQVAGRINQIIPRFDTVAYTRDWHPQDHCSFEEAPNFEDGSWPVHCVQHSPGAEFHGDLMVASDARIFSKATTPEKEAYDAFQDTDIAEYLRSRGIKRVFIAGLATDYCVRSTALAALREGFETVLVEDACRGVAEETSAVALRAMKEAGVQFAALKDFE